MTMVIDGSNGITFPDTSKQYNSYYNFKNRIINGAMVIDQRNAGASGTANGYTVDRWGYFGTQSSKLTWGRNLNSITPPTGFSNYLGVQSSSAYSVLSTDTFQLYQAIEGLNIADFSWGTAGAVPITVSFWVRSSLTGTFGASVKNGAANRTYPFTFVINAANTWEYKTITIAGDTSGTWATDNSAGLFLQIGLGSGATFSGTAGSWQAGNFVSATGATSVVGTNGATFYITGVQLEKGTQATSFDYRAYGTELQLCQRYLPAFNLANGDALCMAAVNSSANFFAVVPFLVETRVPPTGVFANNGTYLIGYGSGAHTSTSIAFGSASENCGRLNVGTSGATAGQAVFLQANNNLVLYFNGCEL
jgi:hypothetical protein